MNPGFLPAIPLGMVGARGATSGGWRSMDDAVACKVRMVLETRPGAIPWRPDFGCDLAALAGMPATRRRVGDAQLQIRRALERWLPEVEVRRVDVRVVPIGERSGSLRFSTVPVAETALLNLGIQARLEVHVEVVVPDGAVAVRAVVAP